MLKHLINDIKKLNNAKKMIYKTIHNLHKTFPEF